MPSFKNPFKKAKTAGGGGSDKAPTRPQSGPTDFGSNDLAKQQVADQVQTQEPSLLDDLTEEKAKPAAKKGGSRAKSGKRGVSPEDAALREQVLMQSLIASGLMAGPKAAKVDPKADHVKSKNVTSKEKVGAGSENEVTKIGTKTDIGTSGKRNGFFKKDSKNGQSAGKESGIGTKKGDGHMAARSVASSRLDKALGTDVLSEEKFGKIGGKKGVVSAQADGKQLAKTKWEETSASDYKEAYAPMGPAWAKQENDKFYKFGGSSFADVDLSRPETQKGFSDLAVMDYLTGQIDRHMGNVFVDEQSGKVTGIDNDLAFGDKEYTANRGKSGLESMPDMIDAGTADKLLKMTPEQFVKSISGRKGDYGKLSQEEIEQAKTRFGELQARCLILKTNGELVDEWDANTFAKSEQDAKDYAAANGVAAAGNNYLARALNGQKSSDAQH